MFGLVIFVGAFLLFGLQPMIAKYLLPWFGSTPAVWTTCMLFFQSLLLVGYLYADRLARLGGRRQVGTHLGIALAALAALAWQAWHWGTPMLPGDGWKAFDPAHPQGHLLLLLLCSVGAPYVVLATTNPLMQKWFAAAHPDRSPYPLYAMSNFGSLLGLLGYPAVMERCFTLTGQAWFVAGGFVLYAALCWACSRGPAVRAAAGAGAATRAGGGGRDVARIGAGQKAYWVLLALGGAMLLLAITNQLCAEVAVVPMLWVVPLALYLVTFMLAFGTWRVYHRPTWLTLLALTGALGCLCLLDAFRFSLPAQVAIFGGLLFSGCMFCHGELARARPPATHLTGYYLWISAGGALGGLLVGIGAPLWFRAYWEFHLAVGLCGFIVLVVLVRDRASGLQRGSRTAAALLLPGLALGGAWIVAPLVLTRFAVNTGLAGASYLYYGAAAIVGLLLLWLSVRRDPASAWHWGQRIWPRVALACGLFVLEVTLGYHLNTYGQGAQFQGRNFYGVMRVKELTNGGVPMQTLIHGRIIHGMQYRDAARAPLPTSYFTEHSGVGLSIMKHERRAAGLRVGVIGLGVGTLATYARTNDVMRFYEINPMVAAISAGKDPLFTFLRDATGPVEVVLGDARLEMERELREGGGQAYDVLVLDAFSSDAIPVHLLTREAFHVYAAHLRGPASILALHCSNRVLDLLPVARAAARELGMELALITQEPSYPRTMRSDWVLLTRDAAWLAREPMAGRATRGAADGREVAWTDAYSSLLDVLIR